MSDLAGLIAALSPAESAELDRHLVALTTDREMPEYRCDPIRWAHDCLAIPRHTLVWSANPGYGAHVWDGDPDPLAIVCRALADWEDCGVESATTTGKTFLAAVLLLWFLACWDGARVYTFATKEDQLRLFMWSEVRKLWPRFKLWFPNAELTDLCIRMRGGTDDTWSAHGYAVGISADEDVSSKASGMHAEHMLLIYEETQGQSPAVLLAGENTSTAPHNLRLAIGNPNHQLDPLHQFCRTAGVRAVRISALDHPNVVTGNPNLIPGGVSARSIERRRAKYGEHSPVYQSRIRGMSPEQAADSLIRKEWLEAAAARYRRLEEAHAVPHVLTGIGLDVANSEHGDKAARSDWSGAVQIRLTAFACPDANALARQVHADAPHLAAHRIGVDTIGVGAGTVNEFRRLGRSVQAINNAAPPLKWAEKAPDGSSYEWAPDANLFENVRAQSYWQLREDLMSGGLTMAQDDELWQELLLVRFSDESRVVKITPKKEIKTLLGRSPDKMDAVVMGNWVRERERPEPEHPHYDGQAQRFDYGKQQVTPKESGEAYVARVLDEGGPRSTLAGRYLRR